MLRNLFQPSVWGEFIPCIGQSLQPVLTGVLTFPKCRRHVLERCEQSSCTWPNPRALTLAGERARWPRKFVTQVPERTLVRLEAVTPIAATRRPTE